MMNWIASWRRIKEPTSVLPEIISRINYLSLARSRINLSICISPHIFTSGIYCIDILILSKLHSNSFDNKDPSIKPMSVLTKIIPGNNYLSLTRSRIDLSIGVSLHIFTNTTKPDISHSNCIDNKAWTKKPALK